MIGAKNKGAQREMGKEILLLAPTDYDLYESIKENIEDKGYKVNLILNRGKDFKYKNIGDRLYNLYRKLVLKDYDYKEKLRVKFLEDYQIAKINESNGYECCIVIRADFFSPRTLEQAKLNSKRFVSYHYDGLGRNLDILDKIGLFDDFFVFDQNDIKKYPDYNLKLLDNFYFDCYPRIIKKSRDIKTIYFLGSYHSSRETDLLNCYSNLSNHDIDVRISLLQNIYSPQYSDIYLKAGVTLLSDVIPYKKYLEELVQYDMLLDLLISEHQGLSFRIFEGLFYKKKVITNNKNIRDRDFYHPNNYYIIEGDEFLGLKEFLESPYIDIDSKTQEKYSFSAWFNKIIRAVN